MNTAQFIFVTSIYSINVAVLIYFKVKRLPDIDSSFGLQIIFCTALTSFLMISVYAVGFWFAFFYKYLGAAV